MFDSVEWNFLFQVLKQLNFGETSFHRYLGLKITVESQKLAACPISALLCLLVAELLSLVLKNDKEIKGIKCLIGKEI